MNARGEVAVYTGPKATEWAGHRVGKFCSAQGNILAGESVVSSMVEAFEKTTGHLSLRLLAASCCASKWTIILNRSRSCAASWKKPPRCAPASAGNVHVLRARDGGRVCLGQPTLSRGGPMS
jgi:hypothetical protein